MNKITTDALNTYGNVQPGQSITVTSTTTTTTVVSKNGGGGSNNDRDKSNFRTPPPHHFSAAPLTPYGVPVPTMEPWAGIPPSPPGPRSPIGSPRYLPMDNYGPLPPPPPMDLGRPLSPPPPPLPPSPPMPIDDVLEDDNSIVVGLRVYTQKSAPTLISGKLKSAGS